MSNVPSNLKYAASHEWVLKNEDGSVTVGITDHAQEALGDLVFVELPEVGAHYAKEGDIAVVESVKAAADVYAPDRRHRHRSEPGRRRRAGIGQCRRLRRLAVQDDPGQHGRRRRPARRRCLPGCRRRRLSAHRVVPAKAGTQKLRLDPRLRGDDKARGLTNARIPMTQNLPLSALEQHDEFIGRHIGPCAAEMSQMLADIGAASLEQLIDQTVPAAIRLPADLPLPAPRREHEALADLKAIASKNVVAKSCLGMGYYDTLTPKVILRNVMENPGWYTAYTPYQAEIAQGRLEALMNFQQMVVDLTGLEIANASLLDEATAAAEAMTMARRVSKSKSNRFLIDANCFPQTIDVVKTRAGYFGFDLVIAPIDSVKDEEFFGALLQYPGDNGEVRDLTDLIAGLKAKGACVAVASDLMALVLLKSPGTMGADIALGSSQRFGIPMGFGGPHAAFFATRAANVRSMAGPHHRHLQGCPRQDRLSHDAADARTAHPPRKGQLQHLYLAGAARQHGGHVRRLSRAARPEDHRRTHPAPGRHPRGRPEAGRGEPDRRTILRYVAPRSRRPRRNGLSRCTWPPATTCAASPPACLASRSTKPPPATTLPRCSGVIAQTTLGIAAIDAAASIGLPKRPAARRTRC